MKDASTTLQELKEHFGKFRDAREWAQFHNPKDISMALSVEASELMELYLWGEKEMFRKRTQEDEVFRGKVRDELSDVICLCMAFSAATGIDIASAVEEKLAKTAKKYPVEKSKGRYTKYNEL